MANKFDIDPDLIKKLAGLLEETGLSEIEFESTGKRIRVARSVMDTSPAVTVAASPSTTQTTASAELSIEQRQGTSITAPMVGTIFLSPEPGAEQFIQVGDTISEGQTVMLIEAMKTYNPVRATKSGKVTQILVADSTPVEFGEELLLIE
ncbi:MAG: Biotin carboxyl carrier protein of acetyl-CoA carboxylase [Alphaproteobacteria bacterium MarineAlpha11_Bin1]|nr:MAG: Biotin carboxyl carrier protein of acetyl-CoA carboxylase [Alphaproteobacteria bacterium MarineAlpha11_Bin1]|tara:strand:+ start:659 stop:1108 length:450 start_codon:yes stop_codon:yes gene_type:complete